MAASHIRVGTFEYVAARGDEANLRVLADYTINRHYPELSEVPNRYLEFFRAVLDRQAALIARWQLVGFIHGVMNTDNMAISGETIDYGPCAFMNAYSADTVFSSIDHAGRYAYRNQPTIAQWNLARFGETLIPLIDPEQETAIGIATEVLGEYPAIYQQYWLDGMRAKLGLQSTDPSDSDLVQSLLNWMQKSKADFTNTFRDLSADVLPTADRYANQDFQEWHAKWQQRLKHESRPITVTRIGMRHVNPAIIPRNHRVEEALAAAEDHNDLSVLNRLLNVLATPYEAGPGSEIYQMLPSDDGNYRTFCGT